MIVTFFRIVASCTVFARASSFIRMNAGVALINVLVAKDPFPERRTLAIEVIRANVNAFAKRTLCFTQFWITATRVLKTGQMDVNCKVKWRFAAATIQTDTYQFIHTLIFVISTNFLLADPGRDGRDNC